MNNLPVPVQAVIPVESFAAFDFVNAEGESVEFVGLVKKVNRGTSHRLPTFTVQWLRQEGHKYVLSTECSTVAFEQAICVVEMRHVGGYLHRVGEANPTGQHT